MRTRFPILALAILLGGAHSVRGAAAAPAGWQPVRDATNRCVAYVPGDWKPVKNKKKMAGFFQARDRGMTLTLKAVELPLDKARKAATRAPGARVLDESPSHVLIEMPSLGSAVTFAALTRSGDPAVSCSAEVRIHRAIAAHQALANQIAGTLGTAK